MGLAVVTVMSGGLPVVDVTSTNKIGTPVTEAANGLGVPVTKIGVSAAKGAIPVVYVNPPLLMMANQPLAEQGA